MKNYDTIEVVEKGIDEIEVVEKFNPFHDELGRFATSQGFKTYSADPKSKAGAMAIGRSYAAGHGKTINSHANSKNGSIKQNMWWADDEGAETMHASQMKYFQDKHKLNQSGTKKPKPQQEEQEQKQKLKNPPAKQKKPKDAEQKEEQNDNYKQKEHPKGTKLSGEEAIETVAEDCGVSKEKAKQMVESVKAFSGSWYSEIRSYQTNGHPPSVKDKADAIEEFIAKSPKWDGGDIYRGISVDSDTASNIIAGIKNGKAISMMGMSSWSTNKSIASDYFGNANSTWSDGATIIFKASGAKHGTSIRHLSKFPHEDEVLVSNKATWKGVKVTEKKNGNRTIYEVECEEI